MVKNKIRKWDADWDRLRLETKVNKIRNFLNQIHIETKNKIREVNSSASEALYVANLKR